jgi:hypothetical protein
LPLAANALLNSDDTYQCDYGKHGCQVSETKHISVGDQITCHITRPLNTILGDDKWIDFYK